MKRWAYQNIYKYLKCRFPPLCHIQPSTFAASRSGITLRRIMSPGNFDNIKVFEDSVNDTDIMRSIIDVEGHDDTFYILDVADVLEKHKMWISKMPKVTPHYAVKCNSDPNLLKVLAAVNANFDCASEMEIRQVMQFGVSGDRIIFANPAKPASHIKFAKKVNVARMTADNEFELLKIKDIYPDADVVLRIRCDAKITQVNLGAKFGCDPDDEAIRLIEFTKNLGLKLYGFSFHVGSPCGELPAYGRGIAICKRLMAYARSIGCKDCQLIDIGGGFNGESGSSIDKLANIVNDAIKDLDPSVKIISEPGQYYVASAFTLAASLHSKRIIPKDDKMIRMYYVSCGVYGAFIEELLQLKARQPSLLYESASDEKFQSHVWGPTCDSYDYIVKDVMMPECHIGDWFYWTDMGAYSLSLATTFNGFLPPVIYPVIRKSQWQDFNRFVAAMQRTTKTEWNDGVDSLEISECIGAR